MKTITMAVAMAMGVQTSQASAPVEQAALNTWWSASKAMWIGEDAYEAKGTTYTDGQCQAEFNDGIIIPVYTGKPPLTERVVGVLFIGSGELTVDFHAQKIKVLVDRAGEFSHRILPDRPERRWSVLPRRPGGSQSLW